MLDIIIAVIANIIALKLGIYAFAILASITLLVLLAITLLILGGVNVVTDIFRKAHEMATTATSRQIAEDADELEEFRKAAAKAAEKQKGE